MKQMVLWRLLPTTCADVQIVLFGGLGTACAQAASLERKQRVMDQTPFPTELVLTEDATFEQRWVALRLNVQTWYERNAQAAGEEAIGRVGELLWTPSQCTIPSEDALENDRQIDQMLNWYRGQKPLHGAICWYLHPRPPVRLGARLFARGVGPNWEPHWMWCELHHLPSYDPQVSTFEIHLIEKEDSEDEPDPMLSALTGMKPRQVWHLRAFQRGKGVGGCILNGTTGAWGIGGLFEMWVLPEARKQGIGTALAHAACELARQVGCHHVVLNATQMGEPVYQRVGFTSMGYGLTWYVHENVLAQPAPSDDQVRFLEAVGLGDLKTLDERGNHLATNVLQQPTLNGLTPLEIAVRCEQPAAATWLVEHGVIPDLLSAWDLGWKERVPVLLAKHPELVRQKGGRWNGTPLHTAIERNDFDLAKLLLTVPNDLESKDEVFQETSREWARRLQRVEILALLEQ